MFDAIVCLDAVAPTGRLIDLLDIPTKVSENTGEIFTQAKRTGKYKGLFVILHPHEDQPDQYTVEIRGSPHMVRNGGLHNADDFAVASIPDVLDELVRELRLDPFRTKLNTLEFGVNIRLTFPVGHVLQNLIAYKGVRFDADQINGRIYYQATLTQYIVKIYDKGNNILRFEIKTRKMAYLKHKGINIKTVADLLNVENYAKMSQLLNAVFNEIIFDEPTIKDQRDRLTGQKYELYLWGCDARNWKQPNSQSTSYTRDRKQLQRKEEAFRRLVDQYRLGPDWRTALSDQINQKCAELTRLPEDWHGMIDNYTHQWNVLLTQPYVVPKLPADVPNSPPVLLTEVSQNHPLYLGEVCDTTPPPAAVAEKIPKRRRSSAKLIINSVLPLYPDAKRCPTTGVIVDYGEPQNSLVDGPKSATTDEVIEESLPTLGETCLSVIEACNSKSKAQKSAVWQFDKLTSPLTFEPVIKLTSPSSQQADYGNATRIRSPMRA